MFIYFPEFLCRTTKFYLNHTFPKIDNSSMKQFIEVEIKSEQTINFFKLVDKNKLALPKLVFENCFDLSFPKKKSNYDLTKNTISICENYIENYVEGIGILFKELVNFFESQNSNNTANEIACRSLKSCK